MSIFERLMKRLGYVKTCRMPELVDHRFSILKKIWPNQDEPEQTPAEVATAIADVLFHGKILSSVFPMQADGLAYQMTFSDGSKGIVTGDDAVRLKEAGL